MGIIYTNGTLKFINRDVYNNEICLFILYNFYRFNTFSKKKTLLLQ